MQQSNDPPVVQMAEAIVAAELASCSDWAGELEVSCPECGLEFMPSLYLEHINDPGESHAQARALRLLDDWGDRGVAWTESLLCHIAAESGASLLFVRKAAADLFAAES